MGEAVTEPLHLVTAIFRQRSGTGSEFTPIEKYVERVEAIVKLGIPITIFANEDAYAQLVLRMATALVRFQPFRELWLCRVIDAIGPDRIVLPEQRNVAKDTLDYLIIQNSKTELCAQVARETGARRIAWIDAGVTKVCADVSRLARAAELPEGITIPGRVDFDDKPRPRFDEVSWRFLGGFFCGSTESIEEFDARARQAILTFLPRITWDTNLWTFLEGGSFPFRRYTAGHDETFLNFRVDTYEETCQSMSLRPTTDGSSGFHRSLRRPMPDSEINLLKQVLQHRAGFDVDLFGMLNIRTTEHGTVEVTEKTGTTERYRSWDIDKLEDAVQYFVDRRMELKLGLEYESGVES